MLSNCADCETGFAYLNDAPYCSVCCRTVIDGEVHCIHCNQCEAGIQDLTFSKGYCKAAGCQCGYEKNSEKDVYECNLCCECGICRLKGKLFCCICGCECGHCYVPPSPAILLAPKGFGGYGCCPCAKCFPSLARVSLENGESVTMAELQVGDRVQAGE